MLCPFKISTRHEYDVRDGKYSVSAERQYFELCNKDECMAWNGKACGMMHIDNVVRLEVGGQNMVHPNCFETPMNPEGMAQ